MSYSSSTLRLMSHTALVSITFALATVSSAHADLVMPAVSPTLPQLLTVDAIDTKIPDVDAKIADKIPDIADKIPDDKIPDIADKIPDIDAMNSVSRLTSDVGADAANKPLSSLNSEILTFSPELDFTNNQPIVTIVLPDQSNGIETTVSSVLVEPDVIVISDVDSSVVGSKPRDLSVFGSKPRDPSVFGSKPRDPSVFGSKPRDLSVFGSKPRVRSFILPTIPNLSDSLDRDGPLERFFTSLRDAILLNGDLAYSQGFFTNLDSLSLSILSDGASRPSVTLSSNISPDQLGQLSPAAGGNLGDLSPSAGGIAGNTIVNCANAYFQNGWNPDANLGDCSVGGGNL